MELNQFPFSPYSAFWFGRRLYLQFGCVEGNVAWYLFQIASGTIHRRLIT